MILNYPRLTILDSEDRVNYLTVFSTPTMVSPRL